MQARVLHELSGQRTFVVVLRTGEELMGELRAFAKSQKIDAARLTATGTLSDAVLAYFDWKTQDYQSISVRGQVEVASPIGEVASAPSGGVRYISMRSSPEGTERRWPVTLHGHWCALGSK